MHLHMKQFDGHTFGMDVQNAAAFKKMKKNVFYGKVKPKGWSRTIQVPCVKAQDLAATMGQAGWLVRDIHDMETVSWGDSGDHYVIYDTVEEKIRRSKVKDFIAQQIKLQEEYEQKYAEYEEQISQRHARIKKISDKIDRLTEKREALRKPSWYDTVNALAERLANHYGLQYKIYGPFGLNCEVSIHLVSDVDISMMKQDSYSLFLRPNGNWLRYFTGETTNQYPSGSIGDLNGDNNIYAPLPVEFEEILKLVRFCKKEATA